MNISLSICVYIYFVNPGCRLRVSHGDALVDHEDPVLLQLLDHGIGTPAFNVYIYIYIVIYTHAYIYIYIYICASGLHDLDALLHADLDDALVVGDHAHREQRDVDAEGLAAICIYIYIHVYIYIYICRERDRETYVCIYIYTYVYTHIVHIM